MELKRLRKLHQRVLVVGFIAFILSASVPALAIDIYTEPEVMVENGTACVLRCTFKSNEVVSSYIAATWYFQSNQPDHKFFKEPNTIFYFYGGGLGQSSEDYKDRLQFIGDINKKDVSIRINPVQFGDNGTYTCEVKNPPDISGKRARTELRVVLKGALPRASTPVIVGAVIGVLLLLVLILVAVCIVMKVIHSRNDYEGKKADQYAGSESCINLENACAPPPQPIKKTEPKLEGPPSTSPPGQAQGPVIYVQLDHSGSKNSFHKMEPVVYADIRKN
ncbi:myelin protein zero-like protein 1 isoform X1 [Corythoichthys intestinalis]|uniref:myelin protein zero-like protein 1 isoform X1 n=1 Tax=Corythoichthys intestinalis TaxID=161448 RepID=UPI0025A5D917|nr:myelin protein zero-like protein 1 isoform X1 [Corythoichthys intestinalis]